MKYFIDRLLVLKNQPFFLLLQKNQLGFSNIQNSFFSFGICVVFLLSSISSCAQGFGSVSEVRDFQKGIKIGFGGVSTQYNNSNILEQGKIFETGLGYQFELHGSISPLAFELNFFKSEFQEEQLLVIVPSDVKVQNFAGDASAIINLLPTSYFFFPYIGAGYQFNYINISSETDDNFQPINLNTSGLIWRAGLWINFNETWGIKLDYRQSFPSSVDIEQDQLIPEKIWFNDKKETIQVLTASLIYSFKND